MDKEIKIQHFSEEAAWHRVKIWREIANVLTAIGDDYYKYDKKYVIGQVMRISKGHFNPLQVSEYLDEIC